MKRHRKFRIPSRFCVWAIVPVSIVLSFCVKPVPDQWGLYSLYTTISKLALPKPQAVFKTVLSPKTEAPLKKDEPVSVVEQTAKTGTLLNQTDYTPDLTRTFVPELKDGGPQVLIVHTHTCEAYTPSEAYAYTPTDTDRTEDTNFNMIKIGREAKRVLEGMGVSVLLDETVCDLPSYSGSYKKSLSVMQETLKKYPSVTVVLDLHRDAIELDDGSKVKLTATIDGDTVAQAMAVVGTNANGQAHPDWEKNLAFATAIQETANRLSPGLMRPINLRTGRFNQQISTGALLFEIGTSGNTMDEALLCVQHLSRAIGETLKKNKA